MSTQTNIKKILIISPNWLGDAIMAQSLFILLKQKYPKTQIDILCPDFLKVIFSLMPQINQIITHSFSHGKLEFKKRLKIAHLLKENQYDLAIILPDSLKASLIPYFAKIPFRRGFLGEIRYGLLNQYFSLKKIEKKLGRKLKMLEKYALLVEFSPESILTIEQIPKPELILNNSPAAQTLQQKLCLDFKQKKYIGIAPGAEYGETKKWFAQRFAQLIQKFDYEYYFIIIGSNKEKQTAKEIETYLSKTKKEKVINAVGLTDLNQASFIISQLQAIVCNDSGLMHMACALKTKTVVIYGGTSPDYTPPLFESSKIVYNPSFCSPCQKKICQFKDLQCLKNVSVEEVNEKLKILLKEP